MVEYLEGKGIDVSKKHYMAKTKHHYIEPDNLYLIRNKFGIENYDYLYSRNLINETKYYRILLYEWFLIIRKGGYIIMEFANNDILDYEGLKNEISALDLYKGRYRIFEEIREGRSKRIIIKKTESIKKSENEINQWTFGIVTNGKRRDFIKKAIYSIRRLNIPEYEIILCGTYYGETNPDIKYIRFTEKDVRGWITKKKNLICENAKYENVAVIHDRIYFDKGWFQGIKEWGNCFDVLSCPVILPEGSAVKYTNWKTVGPCWRREDDYKLSHSNGRLDYSDWDFNVYVGEPIVVLKKSIWEKVRWDEELFWGDAEDIEYSLRQHKSGIMIRLNPYSKMHSSTVSGLMWGGCHEKNSKKLGRYKSDLNPVFVLGLKFLDLLGCRRNQQFTNSIIKILKKNNKATDWRMKT